MIPRLRDLMSKHRVILYTSYGSKFGIPCDNILDAQKLADDNTYNQNGDKTIRGYRIEKIQEEHRP